MDDRELVDFCYSCFQAECFASMEAIALTRTGRFIQRPSFMIRISMIRVVGLKCDANAEMFEYR